MYDRLKSEKYIYEIEPLQMTSLLFASGVATAAVLVACCGATTSSRRRAFVGASSSVSIVEPANGVDVALPRELPIGKPVDVLVKLCNTSQVCDSL